MRDLVFAAAAGLVWLVFACGRYNCDYGEGWEPMMHWGYGGIFMGVPFLILAMVIIAVIWWLAKGCRPGSRGQTPGETPLEILRRRYAAGEITKDQFESMRKDLDV